MMRRCLRWCIVWALLAAVASSCGESKPVKPQGESSSDGVRTGPLKVFVSIPPQAWLVERIGGPQVQVEVLIGPNQDPHTFVAMPRQIAELNQAEVFFAVGLPLERQLIEKMPSSVRVVDVGSRLATLPDVEHEHQGQGEKQAEGAMDPHVWLSLKNMVVMAQAIRDELSRMDPARQAEYATRAAAVVTELAALDARIASALSPLKRRRFYVYHPAFGYFARDYGLVQVPVEIGGKSPSGRQLAALVERAKADGVKIIFVQKQFATTSAEALAEEVGATVVQMDSLPRDVTANFEDMASKMERAIRGAGEGTWRQ